MPKESTKATITSFTGTGLVRVVDDSAGTPLSRNMAVADLADAIAGLSAGDLQALADATRALTQAADDGRYAPISEDIQVRANDFCLNTGSPIIAGSGGSPSWRLDASSIETVSCRIPARYFEGWSTVTISIRAVTYTANTGDVVWRLDTLWCGNGDNILTPSFQGNVTRTAAAQNIEDVFVYKEDIAVTADHDLAIIVYRVANDDADTLAGGIGFLGLDLGKAS